MYGRRLWIFFILLLLLALGGMVESLKCYNCGNYPGDSTGSVTPCTSADEKNVKTCAPYEHYCLKYVNKKMVVRQCVQTCQEKNNGEEEEHCCASDNCNGNGGLTSVATIVIFSATCAAAYQRLRY